MTERGLISPCGLNCGTCIIYYAYSTNNLKLKEKIAQAYNETTDKIACKGCKSDLVYSYCKSCPIKSCASEKNLEGCYQCQEFPCEYIDAFPVPEGKKHILRTVPEWRKRGTLEWIKHEKKLFSCYKCGHEFFRVAKKCPSCGVIQ